MAEFWDFEQVDRDGLVFTSYNSLDWKRVAPIALELRRLGIPMWYDYGLKAGTDAWGTQITRHIKKASAVVLFVTKGIFDREKSYVIEEYREAEMFDVPVIPVFLDDISEKTFYRTIDEKYVRYINFLKDLQGLAYPPDTGARETALKIQAILDRSDEIAYTVEPWADTREQMKEKAEETKTKTDREALADKGDYSVSSNLISGSEDNRLTKRVYRAGDRVRFGQYPQSSNDPEPITWRILDLVDGKTLMISEKLLDCKKYNENCKSVTWETCTLRKWLNDQFLRDAFNAVEQRKMHTVRVQNPDNPRYSTKGGNPTEDKVFCLSIDEAVSYFGSKDDRAAMPTAIARRYGAHVDSDLGTGWWWLRSPGLESDDAAHVISDGNFSVYGGCVNYDGCCVRPVILVSL